ncbi:MAG: hypothetical protein AB8B84_02320 [Granulosicoccus sp.]
MTFSKYAESALNHAIATAATAATKNTKQGTTAIQQILVLEIENYRFHSGVVESIVNGTIDAFNNHKDAFNNSQILSLSTKVLLIADVFPTTIKGGHRQSFCGWDGIVNRADFCLHYSAE